MPVGLGADEDFNAVMNFALEERFLPLRAYYDKSRRIRSAFNCSPPACR